MSTRIVEFAIAAVFVGILAGVVYWILGIQREARVDPDAPPPVYLAETTCSAGSKYEHYTGDAKPDPLVWKEGDCAVEYKTNPEYLGWVAKQQWLAAEAADAAASGYIEEEVDCDFEDCEEY